MNVTIRFRADQPPYVRERVWQASQSILELPDGRIDLSFQAGGVFEVLRWVMGWGAAAEVLRPKFLHQQVAAAARRMSENYSRKSTPSMD